jgi:hypothetical protein
MSPSLTYAQQQQLIKKYLAAAVKSHETAAGLVMSKTAQRLKQVTAQELKRFKKGPDSRGNFHKAVKQYDFPKAKGTAGPASYVRLGVPWIHIFEEGGTVQGSRGALIILLDTGAKLGFKRVKPFGWQQVWNQIKDHAVVIPASDGHFIGLKNIPNAQGQPTLIYKIQKAPVRVPKKLNFYDNAERLADKMPDEINKLIK